MVDAVDAFIEQLQGFHSKGVFNPWNETDQQHDLNDQGAVIRREQLRHYLRQRIGRADCLLCAEAIGYQGGHFSGIPMTSERLLLGGLRHKHLSAELVFSGYEPQRTSQPVVKKEGFTEPTATVVWGFFVDHGIDPYRVVLWNAFPWHPYHPHRGMLSNRTPTDAELAAGHKVLMALLELGQFNQVVAVGEKSAQQLCALGIKAKKVRHPANGGAGQFREQLKNRLALID